MKGTSKITSDDLLKILKAELLDTVGCTDPAAIAFAAAAAGSVANNRTIAGVELFLDKNILKNAQAVMIPGTGKNGLLLAAALGIVKNRFHEGILVFNHLSADHINNAEELIQRVPFELSCNHEAENIYIEVKICYDDGHFSHSLIEYKHDNLIYIKDDKQVIFQNSKIDPPDALSVSKKEIPEIEELIQLIESLSDDDLSFLEKPRDTNILVADAGLTFNAGLGLGTWLKNLYETKDDNSWPAVIMRSRYKVAAATDSRMGGLDIPVVACGGSGNHGLTYFITLNEAVKGSDYCRSAALGLSILHYIKMTTGVLTVMCGCAMAAGMAASAGISYSLGGNEKSILRSMNYVLGFLGGVVCEGAKKECSLKTSLSSQIAVESALVSLNENKIDGNAGLFSNSFKGILENLGLIHKKGMSGFDEVMVNILLKKNIKIDNQI